ncbi:MAG: hypothetical protein H5T44_04440 [Thermoplasmatales archaeon]|nr:hypothetical protein [Thermoplasmatales archaeon]
MKKIITATILFGSIWGLIECSLGDWLHGYNMSFLTASIAIFIMALTRNRFHQPGMQAGMALIAGLLRYFNPFGACLLCASIAIIVEGIVFEGIWVLPWKKYESLTMRIGMGIISFYTIYFSGYFATQILTPLIAGKFYLHDIIPVIPKILSTSTFAGLIGSFALPLAYLPVKIEMGEKVYYASAYSLIVVCWLAVIFGI